MTHPGLDISRWQDGTGPRSSIDYQKAYQFLFWISGGETPFVFINSASPYYAQDRDGFRAAGCEVAAYYFADPTQDAIHSEQAFRLGVGDIPAALDLEVEHPAGWPATAIWGQEWLSQPRESASLLYSNLNFLDNMPGAPWGHPIWFAGTVTPPPGSWVWQYSQIVCPGISGPVDINKWVGTEAQFQQFFRIPQPPAPPKPPGLFVRFRNWLPWFHRPTA